MASVTIMRRRAYADVFTGMVSVPAGLEAGLRWIEAHCPLNEPTIVSTNDLAAAWGVPEGVIRVGLRSLADTGYFTFTE